MSVSNNQILVKVSRMPVLQKILEIEDLYRGGTGILLTGALIPRIYPASRVFNGVVLISGEWP